MTSRLVTGPNGTAVQLKINPRLSGAETTVAWWLLTGSWHPVWPQFILSVVHLRPVEGAPPAKLHFPGATHELLVVALNPGDPPKIHSRKILEKRGLAGVGGYLTPIDVCHQFTAVDAEMYELAALCAQACVDGLLNPSVDDARERLREQWLSTCVKTLAHMRGEEHAL